MADYRIEMYGIFKRLAQADSLTISCDIEPVSVALLLEKLAEQYPDMQDTLKVTAIANGDELVSKDALVSSSDDLALIPPVSGGQ